MATVAMMAVGTVVSLFSGMQQASAIEQQGKQQQQIAAMQAEQTRLVAERNALIITDSAKHRAGQQTTLAGQERASSQRAFLEQRRQTALAVSRAKAVSGASGGGVGDPTSLDIYGGIVQEGEFGAQTALFEGESAASLLTSQAALTLYEGEQKAAMTHFSGSQQADLIQYQGDNALYSSKVSAKNTRTAAIGKAAVSAGNMMAKYDPSTSTGSYSTGSETWADGSAFRTG